MLKMQPPKPANKLASLLYGALLLCAAQSVYAQSGNSIYLEHTTLLTQRDKIASLDMYRGHPVLVSMFYGSCPDVCPLLIMSMHSYEKQLDAKSQEHLRTLAVSFDPAHDTPAQLQAIATMHHVDETRWTFASASEIDARKLAALLGIQYRRKPDGTFDHSVLITLLDAEGNIVASTNKLNGDSQFLSTLRKMTGHSVHQESKLTDR